MNINSIGGLNSMVGGGATNSNTSPLQRILQQLLAGASSNGQESCNCSSGGCNQGAGGSCAGVLDRNEGFGF